MSNLKKFKVKDTGEVVTYPEHFADHPVFGLNIEPYDDEREVDKVVVQGHELPVEQRVSLFEVDSFEDNDTEYDDNDNEERD